MSKVMIIMRGAPGSGKSTKAKELGKDGAVYAADDFFMVGGKYVYDQAMSGHAHLWTQSRVRNAMKKGVSPIVVDNTNVKAEHAKPYVDLARQNGYEVQFEEPDSPWWKKWFSPGMTEDDKSALVKELVARGTHDVPEEVIRRMLSEWEHDMPERLLGEDKLAMLIIDARLTRTAADEDKGDQAPGQKPPPSEEEIQRREIQTSEPTPKVKSVDPGTPIPKSEIPKKQFQALQPVVGPLRGDPNVQFMMKNPKSYEMFRSLTEQGLLGKAVQIQNRFKDPAKFQEAFPPLKSQEPAIRRQVEKAKPQEPADSKPKQGKPGAGSDERQGPATRAPIPTAKASLRTAQQVSGDEPRIFADIPGVEGHVNLNVGVQKVFDAMKSVFPPDTFQVQGQPMSVMVGSLPGKFGEARYDPNDPTQQGMIHIDLDNIIGAVHRAVENEALRAAETGVKAQITDDIAKRINMKIAEQIWETLAHEAGHLRDYQAILKRMQETGQGSLGEAMESVGEKAGKDALGRFRQDAW